VKKIVKIRELWYFSNMLKKNYNFPVIIERDENGYFVVCPDLQGCYSHGDTYEEALSNIENAIKIHVEDRLAEKQEFP
jgi:predicted RNase H-like HicB family nuclease